MPSATALPPPARTATPSSAKRSTAVPSMLVIRSPDRIPASAAAPPAETSPTTAGGKGWPPTRNRKNRATIENRKFAIGPAAAIAARWPTGL